MTTFKLSVEEVAFALGYVGGADTAAGFLISLIGQHTAEDLTGRLTAASHSLVARELLASIPGTDEMVLDPAMLRVANSMVKGKDVLRVTASAAGGDQVVSFFLDGAEAVQHRFILGAVSQITLLDDLQQVASAVADVVAPASLPGPAAELVGRIPVDRLRELRVRAETTPPSELASLLPEFPEAVTNAIVTVVGDAAATWTTTLRLVTGEAGSVESDRGFFTVFISGAGWLFDMGSDSMWATVYPLQHGSAVAAATRIMAA